MDDMPSWLDVEGLKTQLDGGVPAELGSSISVAETPSKVSKHGLMSSPPTLESYRSSFLMRGLQDAQVGGFVDFRGDDSLLDAQIQHQLSAFPMESGMQLAGVSFLGVNSNGRLPLLQSMHPGVTNSMLSTFSNVSLPASSLGLALDSRSWHQPYIGEMQPLLTDMFSNSNTGTNPLCFRVNMDGTRGVFAAPSASVPGLPQANTPFKSPRARPINPMAGAPSPRVRARRGQATDPHSIAERKRREKIAKVTRDLQMLLPNANKTDKVIMLDEVIEYVKFLQLQLKVLGINRVPGSSPSPLPSEYSSSMASHNTSESLANIERQVIQLMDENMNAALQFLQSNGFCLMPISMAATN